MIHASDKYSIYIKILIYIRYISKISDFFDIFINITIFSIPESVVVLFVFSFTAEDQVYQFRKLPICF